MSSEGGGGIGMEEFRRISGGFMESRIVLTAVELDVFSAVGEGGEGGAEGEEGATAAAVAGAVKADARATEMLLNALVALGLLGKDGGTFRLSEFSSRHLVGPSRGAAMHTVHLWPSWSGLTECIRTGTAADGDELVDRGDEWTEAFIAAMHHNASARAASVVEAVGIEGAKRVLDLGGGSGAYAIAFANAADDVSVTVFDLPTVTPLAEKYVAEAGLSERISTQTGDMTSDDLGSDYDIVWISAICHMFGPGENLALFERVMSCLRPGGRIAVSDFVLESDKTAPRFGAVFALNMLVNTREGSSYSGDEYMQWLGEAGFEDARVVPLPGPAGLVIARKSGK